MRESQCECFVIKYNLQNGDSKMEATCVYNTATKKSVGPNNRNQGLEAPFPFGLPKLLDPTLPALGFGPVPDSSDCK